jgi:hypothetical protein
MAKIAWKRWTIGSGQEPRICNECTPSHAENCGTCFGWGLHDPPVTDGCKIIAGHHLEEAAANGRWKRCQECGGSPVGREP